MAITCWSTSPEACKVLLSTKGVYCGPEGDDADPEDGLAGRTKSWRSAGTETAAAAGSGFLVDARAFTILCFRSRTLSLLGLAELMKMVWVWRLTR